RFQRQDVQMVEGRETIRVNGRVTPIVDLAQALGLGGTDRTGNFVSAVVLGGEQNAVAFAVDEVLDEQEVLAKQLGRPLHRLPYVAGITALGSGEPAPILKAAELLRFSSQVRGPFLQPAPVKVEPEGQPPVRILVAEDSLTSRLLLEAILQGAGYQVQTVIDGVEAYDQLRAEHYDLLVSDVEMPRLDGYGLTARIRADNRLH